MSSEIGKIDLLFKLETTYWWEFPHFKIRWFEILWSCRFSCSMFIVRHISYTKHTRLFCRTDESPFKQCSKLWMFGRKQMIWKKRTLNINAKYIYWWNKFQVVGGVWNNGCHTKVKKETKSAEFDIPERKRK